jgi:hypothetical protein
MADEQKRSDDVIQDMSAASRRNYEQLVAAIRRSSKNLHEVNMRLRGFLEEELEKSGNAEALAKLHKELDASEHKG